MVGQMVQGSQVLGAAVNERFAKVGWTGRRLREPSKGRKAMGEARMP
jgi:hypothetical protein